MNSEQYIDRLIAVLAIPDNKLRRITLGNLVAQGLLGRIKTPPHCGDLLAEAAKKGSARVYGQAGTFTNDFENRIIEEIIASHNGMTGDEE